MNDNTLLRQLFDKETSTYTYLIANRATNEAIYIDSVVTQSKRDLALLERLGLSLSYAIDTHLHADHVTGMAALRKATGCQVGAPDPACQTCADFIIGPDWQITLGGTVLKAINTPGHTAHHFAFLLNDAAVFTGDALFIGGCGRTDFQEGDSGQLFDTLAEGIWSLPDSTLLYPGHDYKGHTVSTIGEERQCNPRFSGMTRDAFIALMAELKLPPPKQIEIAVPLNLRCGEPN